ncbi:clostridium P-47 protein-domain-containing protein [Nemania sp. FL0916]|nr:clostridium P-47 protein-domain-containing protein [Nemania sp. FL0916]
MVNTKSSGWDVASLVSIPFVNAAIQSSPTAMTVSTEALSVKATFGDWQITVGGASQILLFNIPLPTISGVVTSHGRIITQFDYQSLSATVELVLKFINGDPTGQCLVIDSTSPPTSIITLVDTNDQPLSNTLHDAYIKQSLTTWLGDNLSQFNHVFASVDLSPADSSDTQWAFCKPAVVNYLNVSGSSLASSYLGLIYNTAGNSTPPGLATQIDPSFIPAGCQAAFMLSPQMFLTNFVAPSAGQSFKIPPQSLSVDTDQLRVTLGPSAQVALAPVSAGNSSGSSTPQNTFNDVAHFLGFGSPVPTPPKTYQPYLIDLQIALENSNITSYAKTSAVIVDSLVGTLTAFNVSQTSMTIGLDNSKQSLIYTNTQTPVNDNYTEQSQGYTIAQDVLQAVGVTAVAVGAVLTDGADLLAVGALAGVAQGGEQWALASITSDNVNDAPSINNLVSNLTLPIQWSGAGPFQVEQAGLDLGGFFLAGNMRSTAST